MKGSDRMRTVLRAILGVASVGLLIVGLLALGLVSGWLIPPAVFIVAVAFPLLGIVYLTDRRESRLAWTVYVLGFVLFAYLRALADETPVPVQYGYVIALEQALPGSIPTLFLQARLYELGVPDLLDSVTVILHFSYFIAPHLFAVSLLVGTRRLFGRYVVAALGTYYGALLVSAVVPTAPPWLAAQDGYLTHVFRIVEDVLLRVDPETYTYAYEVAGTNAVAAMPSLHYGITWAIALAASRWHPVAGVLGWTYSLAMGAALVYAGEHYVVDLVAGALLAHACWLAAGRLFPGSPLDPAGSGEASNHLA